MAGCAASASATIVALAVCRSTRSAQCLEPLQHHPGVERRQRRPGLAQDVWIWSAMNFSDAEDHTAQAAPLPVDVLCRRIDDAGRPELERALQHRRREDIVDDQRARRPPWRSPRWPRCRALRASGSSGFRGRTPSSPAEPRLCHCVEVRAVDKRRGDAEARQQFLYDIAARAEQRLGRDDMVAGLQLAHQRGGDRRHAGRGGARSLGAFEFGHAALEHRDGRIGEAAIDEAALLALESRLGRLGVS